MYAPPSGPRPELGPQVLHVAVDRPVERIERLPEELLADLLPRPDPAGLSDESGQEVELGPRQRQESAAPASLAESSSPPTRSKWVRIGPSDGPLEPAQHGADPGDEFPRLERLDDVVVGTELEPGHPVDDVVAGREHDHRDRRAGRPERAEDVETRPAAAA